MEDRKDDMPQEQSTSDVPVAWVGLDVGKDAFTAAALYPLNGKGCLLPSCASFENSQAGADRLLGWLDELESTHILRPGVAMEATGVYSERLCKFLAKRRPDLFVTLLRPQAVSRFARGISANKTDRADAQYIVRYACSLLPAEVVRHEALPPWLSALRQRTRARTRLVTECKAMENAVAVTDDPVARRNLGQVVSGFRRAVERLEKSIRELIAREIPEEAREEIRRMATVPGVAATSAAVIYAEVGSLAQYSRRQLSSLSGVCPVVRQSGTSLKRGGISHAGPKALRRILFLDSTQAILRIPSVAALRQRILARPDSSKMTAKCACMRKLLLILRGVVVSGKDYDSNHVTRPPREEPEKSTEKVVRSA